MTSDVFVRIASNARSVRHGLSQVIEKALLSSRSANKSFGVSAERGCT